MLSQASPSINASIARWLMSKGWQPSQLAPNWWSELDQDDGYIDTVAKCNSSTFPTLSEGNFSNSCNAKG